MHTSILVSKLLSKQAYMHTRVHTRTHSWQHEHRDDKAWADGALTRRPALAKRLASAVSGGLLYNDQTTLRTRSGHPFTVPRAIPRWV